MQVVSAGVGKLWAPTTRIMACDSAVWSITTCTPTGHYKRNKYLRSDVEFTSFITYYKAVEVYQFLRLI